MRAFFTPESIRKLQSNLTKHRDGLKKQSLNRAFIAGGEIIAQAAKERVTVKTGALRDSIQVAEEGGTVTVGSNLPYAAVSEYKDKPYLRPAAQSERTKVLKAVADSLRKQNKYGS